VIVYFRQFLKITEIPEFLGYFFHGKRCVFILTENGLGYILGYILKNSSGHPGHGLEMPRFEQLLE
jgi:hypothetical protein